MEMAASGAKARIGHNHDSQLCAREERPTIYMCVTNDHQPQHEEAEARRPITQHKAMT